MKLGGGKSQGEKMRDISNKFVCFIFGFITVALIAGFSIISINGWTSAKPESSQYNNGQILSVRNEINSHESYGEVDLSSDRFKGFQERYQIAASNREDWVENPWAIVFEFTGFPSEEIGNPEYLYVFYPQDNIAIAVLYHREMSDTANGSEWRIDMEREDGIWIITWAGHRQRCSRTLDDGWTKSSCP